MPRAFRFGPRFDLPLATMKIVALEEHFVTPAVAGAWAKLPAKYQATSRQLDVNAEWKRRLLDLADERLKAMDASGIDVQVLSLTTPGTQNLEPQQAVESARAANDVAARAVRAHPDRFAAFATLPTPAPIEAARELERAVNELGMVGAMINGRTREHNMDEARFTPIYQTAAKLKVPIYVHPQAPTAEVREAYYSGFGELDFVFATAGLGWHVETGVQVLRLILSGLFDRLPDLQIIIGHWGEAVLFYLDRIDRMTEPSGLKRPISDYFRSNFWVTPSGIWSERYLRWTIEVMGVDRILYSTDYPYVYSGDDEPRRFLENAALSDGDKAKIGSGNWERLTRREI